MAARSLNYPEFHDEVVDALSAIANPKLGKAIQEDRKSELAYLGVRFPALRARVKEGFSFSGMSSAQVIQIWDDLWHCSQYGDVLFGALEVVIPIAQKQKANDLWPAMSHWIERVDNWCHCDQLGRAYSYLLEHQFDAVYAQMEVWNKSDDLWQRRVSLVSLVHYSGKNAAFLPTEKVLPLVQNCLVDRRYYIQTAVGWVLREMSLKYAEEIADFIKKHREEISTIAYNRATEKLKDRL